MIYIGIDDTDTLDSRGTNQLARDIALALEPRWQCELIVRHQLFFDPRVPYTSKNGSASILMHGPGGAAVNDLIATCKAVMCEWFVEGSDPGLCVSEVVPRDVTDFGHRCKTMLIEQSEARQLAARHGIFLEGLGGTEQGVIGALAAIGLAHTGDDGRIVRLGNFPDDLYGVQPVSHIVERGVRLHDVERKCDVHQGTVDLGKKLRPNRQRGRAVLFVQPDASSAENELFHAMKLP